MSEKCRNYEDFICISLEIIQVGNKTEAITMYVNPYAPVNPAMLGIPQQRLATGFQQQMPQGYQQQFARKRPECRNSSVHPYLYSKRFPAEKNRKEDTRH